MRFLYFSGPGDIVNTFRLWCDGEDDPHQQAITYSGQFYSACKNLDIDLVAISKEKKSDQHRQAGILAKNRSTLWDSASGIRFYLGYLIRGLYIIWCSIRYRSKCVFVADGNTFWFLLLFLPLIGKRVVPVLHCTFWPRTSRPTKVSKWLLDLSAPLFRRLAYASMSVSADVTEQINIVRKCSQDNAGAAPVLEFIPSYRNIFADVEAKNAGERPFKVLFASRIEENKGVFILLDIARKIRQDNLDMLIDVAGDGSDLERFKAAVLEEGLADIIQCHGYCFRDKMKQLIVQSHVFFVPTSDTFVEGFNKVCAESVLCRRPLVASSVCPALSYVKEIAVAVEPNDIDGFFEALKSLYFEEDKYQQMCEAAEMLQPLFLSQQFSFQSAVELIGRSLQEGGRPKARNVQE